MQWNIEETTYLEALNKSCQDLSIRFKQIHDQYLAYQKRVRIPIIGISAVAGTASFGSGSFPGSMKDFVSIVVGILNIAISVAGAVEGFLKWNDIISQALKASCDFQKLAENITLELNMNVSERRMSGIDFTRECFTEYESIWNNSPMVLKRMRFIKPMNVSTPAISEEQSTPIKNPYSVVKICL
jgi:hypothetical protein